MKKPITLIEQDGMKRLSMIDNLSSHLTTHAYLYLQELGWFNDYPCDDEGITPWYTFPAIAFLKDILLPDYKILEYGSGFSTLYYKNKVQHLVTIEHNKEWAEKLLLENDKLDIHLIGPNEELHPDSIDIYNNFKETFPQVNSSDNTHDVMHGLTNLEFGGYASRIFQAHDHFYDVVVIDGMARALCAVMAVESKKLKDDGIIILDNSDRWQYNHIQVYLNKMGYGRLDFWGPGWNNYHAWCTSFYSKKFPVNNQRLLRNETTGPILT